MSTQDAVARARGLLAKFFQSFASDGIRLEACEGKIYCTGPPEDSGSSVADCWDSGTANLFAAAPGLLGELCDEVERLRAFAEAQLRWEGNLLLDDEAWGFGARPLPQLTQSLWDELLAVQLLRIRAMGHAQLPSDLKAKAEQYLAEPDCGNPRPCRTFRIDNLPSREPNLNFFAEDFEDPEERDNPWPGHPTLSDADRAQARQEEEAAAEIEAAGRADAERAKEEGRREHFEAAGAFRGGGGAVVRQGSPDLLPPRLPRPDQGAGGAIPPHRRDPRGLGAARGAARRGGGGRWQLKPRFTTA